MKIEETTPAATMPDPFVAKQKPSSHKPNKWAWGLSIGVLGIVAISMIMPMFSKAREKSVFTSARNEQRQREMAQEMAKAESGGNAADASRGDSLAPASPAPATTSKSAVGGMQAEDKPAQDTYVATTPTIKPPTSGYGLTDKIQIAYTANLSLETEHVASAVEKAEMLFNDNGGFVLSSNLNRADYGTTASVTGRVTADKLATFLVELDKLGVPKTRTITGDDVTIAQIEQLEKLNQLGQAQTRLGDIADNAKKTGDELNIENQRRQLEREELAAKIEELRTKMRVTLATVTVSFFTPDKPEPPATIGTTAMTALHGLQSFAIGLGAILLVLLIWSPVWLLPLLLIWWLWKKYNWKDIPVGKEKE